MERMRRRFASGSFTAIGGGVGDRNVVERFKLPGVKLPVAHLSIRAVNAPR